VSPQVIHLAQGVLKAMLFSKRKAAVVLVLGLAASGVGALAGRAFEGKAGTPPAPAPGEGPRAGDNGGNAEMQRRIRSVGNLKQIAQAVHRYAAAHGNSLPSVIKDGRGKLLLSWRVALLPYLGEKDLFKQFTLDEPWDSPHNKKLLYQMPAVFRIDGAGAKPTSTFYRAFAGKRTLIAGERRYTLGGIPDGTSSTVLVVEAAEAVPWTKPEDLPYAEGKPLPKIGGLFRGVFHAAFADGSVRTLKKDFNERMMRRLIDAADGLVIDMSGVEAPPWDETGLEPATLREENKRLERSLREANRKVESLRRDLARLQKSLGVKHPERVELLKLLAERDRLEDAFRETTLELKALSREVESLKKALER
jgi:hypothetical protein